MSFVWQYPQRSEPTPFTTPEFQGIKTEAAPPLRNWQAKSLFRVAAIAPAFFIDPHILTQPEQVSVDKFKVEYSDIVNRKPREPQLQPSVFWGDPGGPEAVSVDKFAVTFSDKVDLKTRRPHLYPATFVDELTLGLVEQVSGDKTKVEYADAVDRKLRQPHLQPSHFFLDLGTPEVVSLDKFSGVFADKVDRKPRRPYLYPSTFIDEVSLGLFEQVSLDKFEVRYPDSARVKLRSPELQPSQFFDETPVAPPADLGRLDWYTRLSEPRWSRRPLPIGARPAFFIDPWALTQPETVSLDRFATLFTTKVDGKLRQPWSYPSQFFDESPVVVGPIVVSLVEKRIEVGTVLSVQVNSHSADIGGGFGD